MITEGMPSGVGMAVSYTHLDVYKRQLLFGALLRDTGSYTAMLGFCFACFVVGPLLLLTLGGYPVFRREALPVH